MLFGHLTLIFWALWGAALTLFVFTGAFEMFWISGATFLTFCWRIVRFQTFFLWIWQIPTGLFRLILFLFLLVLKPVYHGSELLMLSYLFLLLLLFIESTLFSFLLETTPGPCLCESLFILKDWFVVNIFQSGDFCYEGFAIMWDFLAESVVL